MRHRTTLWAILRGSTFRIALASGSTFGIEMMYVGVRWSIVTESAASARAGISVIAVAPLPITTTFLPVTSRSSGQN